MPIVDPSQVTAVPQSTNSKSITVDPSELDQPIQQKQPKSGLLDKVIDFARPFAAELGATAGGLAGSTVGPEGTAAGGILGYGLVDRLMQHLQTQPPQGLASSAMGLKPGSFASDSVNSAEQFAMGKAIESAIKPLSAAASNAYKAYGAPIVDPELAKLGATFSQYFDPNSYMGKMAKFVEDTFSRGSKQQAVSNSAQIGFDATKAAAAKMAGRSVNTISDPMVHSQLAQMQAKANYDELDNAVKQFATEANMYKPKFDVTQKPQFSSGSQTPIEYKATDINNQLPPLQRTSGPNYHFYSNPVEGYDSAEPNVSPLVQTNKNFDPIKYDAAVKNAAAVAKLRDNMFDDKGLGGMINDMDNNSIPFMDKIIADPQKLQRAFNTGKVIPGTKNFSTDAVKGDFQGYYLNKLIDSAADRDSAGKIISIDTNKLYNQFNNPSMAASMKELYSAPQRADISQLFKNLAKTQQKMGAGFSTSAKIFWGAEGLNFLASMFGDGIKWGYPGTISAIRVGGYGLGRVMTNPKIARALVAASSGQPMSLSAQTIAKELSKTLNGVAVSLVDKNGNTIDGKIDNGQFMPAAGQWGSQQNQPQQVQ